MLWFLGFKGSCLVWGFNWFLNWWMLIVGEFYWRFWSWCMVWYFLGGMLRFVIFIYCICIIFIVLVEGGRLMFGFSVVFIMESMSWWWWGFFFISVICIYEFWCCYICSVVFSIDLFFIFLFYCVKVDGLLLGK